MQVLKLIFYVLLIGQSSFAESALDYLKQSDRARGGIGSGVLWQVKVLTDENDEKSEREFLVKAKGDDALAEATSPARTKGEIFLINNRNMWFFKPSLKKPVAISSRQKLSGQAANGDIASTNYARDYSPTEIGEEKIGSEKVKVFLLKAKAKDVTYDRIKYWVTVKTKLALKAEFQTIQGQPFKIADFIYGNEIVFKGKKTPFVSQMIITDAKFKKNKSVLEYSKPKPESYSDSIFNVNNISR